MPRSFVSRLAWRSHRAFGHNGEGWVRLALVKEPARLEEAIKRIARFWA